MRKLSTLILVAVIFLGGCALPAPIDEGTVIPPEGALTDTPDQQFTATAAVTDPPAGTLEPAPTLTMTAIPATQAETATPAPTNTPAPPTPTPTPDPHVYRLQAGSPLYSPNIFHPELGCEWMGIAGQVLGYDGRPVDNIAVSVSGQLNGLDVNLISVTGSTQAYGDGGYEITLSTAPVDTVGGLWVQLFDLDGRDISDREPLITYSNCDQALVLMNFTYTFQLPIKIFLPAIDE